MPALILECPLCRGVRSASVTTRTSPKVMELPESLASISGKRTGTMPGYRLRTRTCRRCGQPFETAEIPKETFDAIAAETALNRKKKEKLDKILSRLKGSLTEEEHKIADRIFGWSKVEKMRNRFKSGTDGTQGANTP